MVKFPLTRRMAANVLRKISSLIDMIVAGVAVAALIDSGTFSVAGTVALFLFAVASIVLEAWAEFLGNKE